MDFNNQDFEDNTEYYYQLIEFITRGPRGKRKVDIVPSFWPVYNSQKGRMETPFLPPPYTDESFDMFTKFVKDRISPLNTWPMYTIQLIGRAKTYDDATTKLSQLQDNDEVIYTADSDFNPKERAAYMVNMYKERVKQSDLPKIPPQPTISTSSSDDSDSSSWAAEQLKTIVKNGKARFANNKKAVAKKKTKNTSEPNGNIQPPKDEKRKIVVESVSDEEGGRLDGETERKKCRNSNTANLTFNHNKELDTESRLETIDLDPSCNAETYSESTHTFFDAFGPAKGRPIKVKASTMINQGSCRCHESFDTDKKEKAKKKSKSKDETHRISSETQLLLAAIKGISIQQKEILERLDAYDDKLEAIATKAGLVTTAKGFICNNNLLLPFKDVSEFTAFDEKLNGQFRDEFISSLQSLMDRDFNISKSILNILKKYLSKDLATKFTNIKRVPNKLLLKDFKFHQSVVDAVTERHRASDGSDKSKLVEKTTLDAIGVALTGARDWDGGRKERQDTSKQYNI